jgi:hypothetical protein
MYGFLRLSQCKLKQTDSDTYKKSYCGQCHALHKHFGYTSRALLSYDTTLISLLIDAQLQSVKTETKAWCAVFPRKVSIYNPDETAQKISASLSIALLFTKLNDSLQEKKSFFKTILAKYYQRRFNKARKILDSEGFNSDLIDKVLRSQEQVELLKAPNIEDYAEPSAIFVGEVFRFTAKLTKLEKNESILYEIGYHVGKLFYLIDCCIDILDDVNKKQFNALLATYKDENGFSSTRSQNEIVHLVIDSLRTIQTLIKQVTLYKHESLIDAILLQGFPNQIHEQVQKSIKKLKNNVFVPFSYLPHAALASALCLFATEVDAAGFVWGAEYSGYKKKVLFVSKDNCSTKTFLDYTNYRVYGLTCLNDKIKNMYFFCEALLNPFSFIISKSSSIVYFNIPKYLLYIAAHFIEDDFNKFLKIIDVFILSALIIVISFFGIKSGANYISERYNQYIISSETQEKKESIHSFAKSFSPKLYSNIQKINNTITSINNQIQSLQKLQKKYPAQTSVIQPKLDKLTDLNRYLEETLNNIYTQIKTAYVIYEANKIEGIGRSISLNDILEKANNALQQAKVVSISIEEMSK